MSAEPRDSVAQAIDAAVERATRELREATEADRNALTYWMDAAKRMEANNVALRREMNEVIEARPSRCGSCAVFVRSLCKGCLGREDGAVVAKERAEILALIAELTTEYRPGPGEPRMLRDGVSTADFRTTPKVSSGGVVEIPTNFPSPVELWILDRLAKRIRARK